MTKVTRDGLQLVQTGLDQLGHSSGAIDGLWGLRTARALKSLLAANGRPATVAASGPLPWMTEAKIALGRHEARNWLLFGQEIKPTHGALLVFARGSGRHVGFAMGQDDTHFYVLGGNQSDAVTIARIAKPRILGACWPATMPSRHPHPRP